MLSHIRALSFAPSLAVAAFSSLMLASGAPPDGWLPGHWLSWVLLIVMVRRACVTPRQAAWLGFFGGIGVGLVGFPWIAEMLVKFAGVPWVIGWLGLLLFSAWMAIPYAIWALGLRLGPFEGWRAWAWPVALFVALQSLWPVLFPYTSLLGFAERPELIQLAEIGGVHLVEAVVITSALFLSGAFVAESRARMLRSLLVGAAIPLLVYGYGAWRISAIEAEMADAPTLRVGIVQSNVPVGGLSAPVKLARLQEPSARAERAGAELVIWPEAGAYPYGIARPFEHDRELGRGRVLSHHRVPTIFGANSRVPGERFGYNSVFHLDADGKVTGGYDKVNLVPLGESIPLIDPDWVTDRIPQIAHHERGEEPARFFVAGRDAAGDRALFPAAPLICYEDIIPSFVRRAAAQEGGVDLFVNVTIDAWYGDSAEPWEHLALAQFRSVEHRVPMVRSVSTGVSAVIDATGRLGEHIPLRPVSRDTLDRYPPELLVADVALARNTAARPTPFARFGWTFVPLCQIAALATAGGWYLRRRSRDLARVEGRD